MKIENNAWIQLRSVILMLSAACCLCAWPISYAETVNASAASQASELTSEAQLYAARSEADYGHYDVAKNAYRSLMKNKDSPLVALRARIDMAALEVELAHFSEAQAVLAGTQKAAMQAKEKAPIIFAEWMVTKAEWADRALPGNDAVALANDAIRLSTPLGKQGDAVLGRAYWVLGNNADNGSPEALNFFVKSGQAFAAAYTSQHPRVARALDGQAWTLIYQNKFAEGEALARQALAINEPERGAALPMAVMSYNNLAVSAYQQGLFDRAEQNYRKGLALAQGAWGENHFWTGWMHNNMVLLLKRANHLDAAMAQAEAGLKSLVNVYGPNRGYVADSWGNIGSLASSLGQTDKALHAYDEQVKSLKGAQVPQEDEIAIAVGNLGVTYYEAGRLKDAEAALLEALALRIKLFGFEHPDVQRTMSNLGAVYNALGQHEKASTVFAVAGGREMNRLTPQLAYNIGALMIDKKRYEDAEILYGKLLKLSLDTRGEATEFTGEVLHNLGVAQLRAGKRESARETLERAVEIQKRLLGPKHPRTQSTIELLQEARSLPANP